MIFFEHMRSTDLTVMGKWSRWPSAHLPLAHFLCFAGILSATRELLLHSSSQFMVQDSSQSTALFYACGGCSEKLFVELVRSNGIHLQEIADGEKRRMLSFSAKRGRMEAIKLLLKAGASVRYPPGENSPLRIAAEAKKSSMLELFMDACDIDFGSSSEAASFLLCFASMNGQYSFIQ